MDINSTGVPKQRPPPQGKKVSGGSYIRGLNEKTMGTLRLIYGNGPLEHVLGVALRYA